MTIEENDLPLIQEYYISRQTINSDINGQLVNLYNKVIEINAQKVVELGTRYGESTSAFLAGINVTGGHLWSVDLNAPMGEINKYGGSTRWTFLKGNDKDHINNIPNDIDLLFIDTSHTYEDTYFELFEYSKKLASHGVIIMHDTDTEPPAIDYVGQNRAMYEFLEHHPEYTYTQIHGSNGITIIEKK